MVHKHLIIGQGHIGKWLTETLAEQNPFMPIIALATTEKHYTAQNITFWQKNALTLTAAELADITHISIIITPSKQQADRVQAYQDSYLAVCEYLATLANDLPYLQRILFVSSTSVYGQNHGEWVNINTPVFPSTATAQVLYQSECLLQNAFGHRCVIVRPSGIYGQNAKRMMTLAQSAHVTPIPVAHYTNRIMDSDLVRVLCHILMQSQVEPVYIASDFAAASSLAVVQFIRQQLGLKQEILLQHSAPTGKRLTPNIPREWLIFATYERGYAWILEQNIV
ncbi:MAG: NAD-dependent epimerase/dehydratase family protein [Acinetobacter sp.]|nr:NAD-dependent epimerase/dehydratase family protein [Acinetobacter sp.]